MIKAVLNLSLAPAALHRDPQRRTHLNWPAVNWILEFAAAKDRVVRWEARRGQ